jgi:CheY-like chemotaxis protein
MSEASPGAVLVVDDNPLVRATAVDMFRALGVHVFDAYNGEDALRMVAANPQITVALIDVRMPGMSGTDLAARIREMRPQVRVVLISGYVGESPLPDLPFIRKPIRMSHIEQVVQFAAGRIELPH